MNYAYSGGKWMGEEFCLTFFFSFLFSLLLFSFKPPERRRSILRLLHGERREVDRAYMLLRRLSVPGTIPKIWR